MNNKAFTAIQKIKRLRREIRDIKNYAIEINYLSERTKNEIAEKYMEIRMWEKFR